ncbi:hypothetical protein LTR59_007203 [Friedmanniomyces endolithicus]|nr:hypothetical protein LTR94_015681 [Friedmanniomyces endolithicus]KAK0796240.1 hypothetical protein LTR59_007203 [Friedmanniomyces endolithicus]KAK0817537.1 hypothetical protein LTR38_001615 [Friedmanniomyces endolithicus]
MRLSSTLLPLFRFLLPPTLIALTYVYLYPFLQQCSFALAKRAETVCHFDGSDPTAAAPAEIAPFRLLAFADPQLEGDTSLPDPQAAWLPSLARVGEVGVMRTVEGVVRRDVLGLLQGYRKKLDLWGNDLYLAHVYRMVNWWAQPTHTVVLGDLLGSQWVGDEEFSRRTSRFWTRVFSGGAKVPRNVTDVSSRIEVLGQDNAWRKRMIAVAGNHDIGYAGDINEHRIERFESAFGSVNWEIRFRLPNDTQQASSSFSNLLQTTPPTLHLIVLNSMNLDAPAYNPELQQQSLDFLDAQLHPSNHPRNSGTVILTHVPLHKKQGVCVDAPYFSYFPENQGGGIREQNHLSPEISARILDRLAPGGSEGGMAIVLNGHDHEGCDTIHQRDYSKDDEGSGEGSWDASRFDSAKLRGTHGGDAGLREITVRSMMGSYGRNAGLLSGWFDAEAGKWRFEYETCMFGVQHFWWAAHVLALVEVGLGLGGLGYLLRESWSNGARARKLKEA